jgi:hypothetical protein
MIDITGRIICINNLNDKVAQVVIKKKIDGKVVAIAIDIFGIFKKKMEDMKLRKNDKIYGVLHLKSNLYKGKYYTDVFFKEDPFRVQLFFVRGQAVYRSDDISHNHRRRRSDFLIIGTLHIANYP